TSLGSDGSSDVCSADLSLAVLLEPAWPENMSEIGPIVIALMFSGRVGANNTAELGTMTVTEQIDGLRALAIDPIRYLLVPRVLAMIIMLFFLTLLGDLVAIIRSALMAHLLLALHLSTFL